MIVIVTGVTHKKDKRIGLQKMGESTLGCSWDAGQADTVQLTSIREQKVAKPTEGRALIEGVTKLHYNTQMITCCKLS